MSDGSPLTGDPHVDARLEAWRPGRHSAEPLDRMPAPGRERRVRLAFVSLVLVSALLAIGYVAVAVLGATAPA